MRGFVPTCLIVGLTAVLAKQAPADAPLTYQGYIPVNLSLGRIVADPVRDKIYGISTTGQVVFMDRSTMTVEKTIATGRKLVDIDVDPAGQYITVLDNVTNEYWNQPPGTYVIKYDLATQSQSQFLTAQAPMYQMALGRADRYLGVQWNQWVDGYQVNASTGALVSTRSFGYYGGTDWSAPNTMVSTKDGTRVFRTEVGISTIELIALNASTDTLGSAGSRAVGSYSLEPVSINSTDTSLYVGDIRVNPWDITQMLGFYPENIYAGTGNDQFAFGLSGIYDPATGARVGDNPAGYGMMTIGEFDGFLYTFDTTTKRLHVMKIAPEPAVLALLALGSLTVIGRRRQQG